MGWIRLRSPRRKSLVELLALAIVLGILFHYFHSPHPEYDRPAARSKKQAGKALACSALPGAKDVVVALKTSTAELEERLPVHFDTTLLCYPNYILFSEWKETYRGHAILDVLDSVDQTIKGSHPDFELWRRLQKGGPDALEDEELWASEGTTKRLDKWKWLPMIQKTFAEQPDRKWYVFLETDTYIFWSNLLTWLETLDSEKPHYIGARKETHELSYALAGAGFVLSHAAAKAAVDVYEKNKMIWEGLTKSSPYGDEIVGGMLEAAQAPLNPAWPIFQRHKPAEMDYTTQSDGKRLWCYPSVSYHGLVPAEIAELWKFEQQWLMDKPSTIIRHSDVFKSYIMPRLLIRSGRVDDWDNFSGNFTEGTAAETVDVCREMCVARMECVQFAFSNGTCEFSSIPRMGTHRRGVRSRWMLARAQDFADKMEACTGEETWLARNVTVERTTSAAAAAPTTRVPT
ncbi:hypothetical protein Slin15195_G068010 [Septoria linicola]|uniref:Glycosyltransferase family 31 protein n=1 Tax=Septoria linicola TaxID=215465 RepID=A0A9Q9APT3_9PEZI|nr:hypothetical protein Slin15195_G068010 [Septoria linicola]